MATDLLADRGLAAPPLTGKAAAPDTHKVATTSNPKAPSATGSPSVAPPAVGSQCPHATVTPHRSDTLREAGGTRPRPNTRDVDGLTLTVRETMSAFDHTSGWEPHPSASRPPGRSRTDVSAGSVVAGRVVWQQLFHTCKGTCSITCWNEAARVCQEARLMGPSMGWLPPTACKQHMRVERPNAGTVVIDATRIRQRSGLERLGGV